MHLILLLIFAFTVKGDSDESKYVDLLPDKEKEEFIQNVARRITENVEMKEVSNKSSVEIPHDELLEHDAFVKKILKEESNNIRRNRLGKEKESEEDVRVKSIENLKEIQRAGHIDFTVRTDNKKSHVGGKSSEIPVEVITENGIIKTENFGSEVKTKNPDENSKSNHYAHSSKEDIQVRHIKKPVTANIKRKTTNFGTEYSEATITSNVAVKNNDTKYADSTETKVKVIKRRAIENNDTIEIVDTDEIQANGSHVNESESIDISKEYQPTVMDNFSAEKGESSLEETERETEMTETSISETTSQVTTVNVTTEGKGNESLDENNFTQSIHNSELESDSDGSNETVIDKAGNMSNNTENVNETSTLSNTSNTEDTKVTGKIYLRSNDNYIVTDAIKVNNSGNSMESTEISSETVTEIVDDIVQSSTTNVDSTDKIIATTEILGTDENNSKAIKLTKSSETGNSNSDITAKTVQGNKDLTTVSSDVTSITVATDVIVKNISDFPTKITIPTTVLYKTENNTDQGNKGFQSIDLTVQNKFNNNDKDATIDEPKATNEDVIQTTNKNEWKNKTIATDIQSLNTDNNESKITTILTTTESIVTTMKIQKPTRSTLPRVENQTTTAKFGSTTKKHRATTKNIKYTTKAPDTEKIILNHDKPSPVAEQAVDMLKDMLLLVKDDKKKESDIFKGLENEYYKQFPNKKGTHHVYEIPADKPPFIKGSLAITEQPYYVPVYNYSPNKAYFNTHNKLGPNEDDDDNNIEYQITVEAGVKQSQNVVHESYNNLFGSIKDRPNYGHDYDSGDSDYDYNQRQKIDIYTKYSDKISHSIKWPPILRRSCDDEEVDYDRRFGAKINNCKKNKISHKDSHPVHKYSSEEEEHLDSHPIHKLSNKKGKHVDSHPIHKHSSEEGKHLDSHPIHKLSNKKGKHVDSHPIHKHSSEEGKHLDSHPIHKLSNKKGKHVDSHPIHKHSSEEGKHLDSHSIHKPSNKKGKHLDSHPIHKHSSEQGKHLDSHSIHKPSNKKEKHLGSHPIHKHSSEEGKHLDSHSIHKPSNKKEKHLDSHPFHKYSSEEGRTLKHHFSNARQVLHGMKIFGYRSTRKPIMTTTKPKKKKSLRYSQTDEENSAIALDYYFGRMKPEVDEDRPHYKNVGYFKNYSRIKNLYMNNEFYNEDIVKHINYIKYKDDMYINNGHAATPHTDLIEDKKNKKKRRIVNTQESKSNKKSDIFKFISMKDETDVYNNLEKLQEINEPKNNEDDNLKIYLRVLKDMIDVDDNALKQYDWLGTTVDLLSAFEKLLGLIDVLKNGEKIHPSDMELLKYVIFLHTFSRELIEGNVFADKLRKKQFLPRNKSKKKRRQHSLSEIAWLLRKQGMNNSEYENLENLNVFLMELRDSLFELHEAIGSVAKITTFKKQNWFKNIKDLYLSDERSYLSLLLHISSIRVFGLVEDSARKDLESDFRSYVQNNRKDTVKTVEEMLFVLKILDDIKGR